MYWLQRPPYLRWAIAVALVVLVTWSEFAPAGTVRHPYVTTDITAGTPLVDAIEYREVPEGALPPVIVSDMVARFPIGPGVPITPGLIADPDELAPGGWLTITAPLPDTAAVGTRAELVTVDDPGESVTGVVLAAGEDGLVAIPPGSAEAIATAMRRGGLEVLVAVRD